MSTEDEREKRREGSPEWHRRGQIAYGSTASRRWPRSMSRSRERLSSGGNSSGQNSAIPKREIALWNVSSRGGKMPRSLQGEKRPPATLAQRPALN